MDFKKMLMDMAQVQADKMQDAAMEHLASDDFSDMLATWLLRLKKQWTALSNASR